MTASHFLATAAHFLAGQCGRTDALSPETTPFSRSRKRFSFQRREFCDFRNATARGISLKSSQMKGI